MRVFPVLLLAGCLAGCLAEFPAGSAGDGGQPDSGDIDLGATLDRGVQGEVDRGTGPDAFRPPRDARILLDGSPDARTQVDTGRLDAAIELDAPTDLPPTPDAETPDVEQADAEVPDVPTPIEPDVGPVAQGDFLDLTCGGDHCCVRRDTGRVQCWGKDSDARLVVPDETFLQIAGGKEHTCGVTSDGRAVCWGKPGGGRLDAPDLQFVRVAAGDVQSCGMVSQGRRLTCWGEDQPVRNAPGTVVQNFAMADDWACLTGGNGDLECWGNAPDDVPGHFYFGLDISNRHGCALTADTRRAHCFGDDYEGSTAAPDIAFEAIATGDKFSCGLDGDGVVHCWGGDAHGILEPHPQRLSRIAAGNKHVCGLLKNTGEIFCFGEGADDRLVPPQRVE